MPPIPAAIWSLKYGAPPELVDRITHRHRDRKLATDSYLRRWVNAAADGVAGAFDALAHGYARAEAAILSNDP